MKRDIVKNTGVVSLGTNISRTLGLVRDIVIANFFGTGSAASAFVVAFTLPNLLRDTVGEGAANAAFVPVLTEKKEHDTPERFWATVNNIFSLLLAVLTVLTVLGIVLAPLLVKMIAPGFVKEAGAMELAVRLTRVMFPFILFMGITAFFMGVLNTLRHFWVPAFSSTLLNIVMIASALLLCPTMGAMGLALGVLAGGLVQVIAHLPVMARKGFRYRWDFSVSDPALKKIGTLLVPRVLGSTVYQVNVLIDRLLASLFWIVGTGGIPALYYSYRLIQYPIGIFSTALATAVLPVMSQQAVKKDIDALRATVSFSIRSIMLIMIPASAGLMLLGRPIIRIIFERGEFSDYSTTITYHALIYFAIGLFAYGGIRILAICFYAMHDTKTPVKVAARSLIVNTIFNLALMWPLKIGGLALATSIAAFYNFSQLYMILKKRLGGMDEARLKASFIKTVLAVIPMCVLCFAAEKTVFSHIHEWSTALNALLLAVVALAGAGLYAAMAFALKMEEARELLRWILKRP